MNTISIYSLPTEITATILSFCDLQTIALVSQVSKTFFEAVNQELLWKNLVYLTFSSHAKPGKKIKLWVLASAAVRNIQNTVMWLYLKPQTRTSPFNEWYYLYQELSIRWNLAKTQKEKGDFAFRTEFSEKRKFFVQFFDLCEYARKPAECCPIEILNSVKTGMISLTWTDRLGLSPIYYALSSNNKNIIKQLLEVSKDNLTPFKMAVPGLIPSKTPLEKACYDDQIEIFRELFKVTQFDKNYLRNEMCFFYMLKHNRAEDALLLFETYNGHVDHLFQYRDGNGNNVLHLLANGASISNEKIAKFLFGRLKESKELATQLMTSENDIACHSELPIHVICKIGYLPILKIYVDALHELDILDECLQSKNFKDKTPLDLLSRCLKPEDIQDLISNSS